MTEQVTMNASENSVKPEVGFLFDLDGVLIDSEREYTRIWNKINDKYPTGIDHFAIKIKGQTLSEILNSYYPPALHREVINLLNEEEQKMQYKWLPGAEKTLNYLRDNNIGAVLVISSNEKKMAHLREELPGLEDYFVQIVTADKISRSKPDPEGYLLGASLLNIHPRNCVVFEDSVQGVRAGKASGAYVVGLTTTLGAAQIKDYSDLIVPDLSAIDLDRLLRSIKLFTKT